MPTRPYAARRVLLSFACCFLLASQRPAKAQDEEVIALTDIAEAIIARLRDEVTGRGGQLVVVIIGAPEQVYPEQWQQTIARNPAMQSLSWNLDAPNRWLDAFLTKEDIPHLDLLPVFREAASQPNAPALHFRHDQHWTAEGHRLAAKTIYEFLVNNELIESE